MPLGPLAVTAALAGLDWGAWEWATLADHPTVGLIAGLLMAPIAVAFAWSLVRVLVALAHLALRRATGGQLQNRSVAGSRGTTMPFDIETEDERIAA